MLQRCFRLAVCGFLALLSGWAVAQGTPTPRVQVQVVDTGGQPVPGATVVLGVPDRPEARADTDAAGLARFDTAVAAPVTANVQVSKDGFHQRRDIVEVNPATPEAPPLRVELMRANQTALVVTVRGRAGPLPRVPIVVTHDRLGGGGPTYRGVTGDDGVARIVVSTRRGLTERLTGSTDFHVAASWPDSVDQQDPREAVSQMVRVSYQVPSKPVDLLMIAGSADTVSGMPVQVQVSDDDGAVEGATVVLRGREPSEARSAVTDARGTALVEATVVFAGRFGIEVSKPGYRDGKTSIALDPRNRGKGLAEASVLLTKDRTGPEPARPQFGVSAQGGVQLDTAQPTAATAFQLIIRTAEDLEPFAAIPKVLFKLRLADGSYLGGEHETDANGEKSLTVPAHQAARVRQGLTIEVNATAEHGPARTAMGPSQLQPSIEPRLHLVMLRSFFARDLAAASAEVARLEALKGEAEDLIAEAWTAREHGQSLVDAVQAQIRNRFGGQLPATPFLQMQREADQACERAARTAREHIRAAEALGRQSIDLIESAQREAAVCSGPEAPGRIDALQQLLQAGLNELKRQNTHARQQAQDFLARAGGLEQEAGNPLERIRATMDDLQRSATDAATHMARARAAAARLKTGHAAAAAALNGLRARKTLTPAQFGQTIDLHRRLTPLSSDLEPAYDPARLARDDAARMGQAWKQLQATAALFGKPGCTDARASFPRAVETVDANLGALEFTVARADLPGLAQSCRALVAQGAAAALVMVPDVSGVQRSRWPQAILAAGLSWGGEIQVAEPAPSAAQALGYAWQSLAPGAQVQRGVPLSVFVWGPYVPPPAGQSASAPATDPPTGVPPPATGEPSIWERVLRGVAAATPGIVAAVQQSRGQRPAAPAPAITITPALPPAAAPQAPPQTAAAGIGVPNVSGDSLEQAQRKLQAVGIAVRGVSRGGKPPSPELAGRVYHQTPAAGTAVMRGMAADLMVYDNDRSTVTPPPATPAAATTRYDRPTQGGLPIHQCATAGAWPNGDCGSEGAQYFCVNYKGHQRVYGFKTYTVPQSFRLKDGTRCVQGLCPAFLEVVCQ